MPAHNPFVLARKPHILACILWPVSWNRSSGRSSWPNSSLSGIESQRVRAGVLNEMIIALDLALSLPMPRFVQCQQGLLDKPISLEAGSTSGAVVPFQDIGRDTLPGGHVERASLLATGPSDLSRGR